MASEEGTMLSVIQQQLDCLPLNIVSGAADERCSWWLVEPASFA